MIEACWDIKPTWAATAADVSTDINHGQAIQRHYNHRHYKRKHTDWL